MPHLPPLTLRILSPGRLDVWHAFHGTNKSKFVKERDPDQLLKAAAAQKLFVLEDDAGQPEGSCGLFEYGDGTYREAGAVSVPRINGFGLQVLLMSAAVCSDWVYDPPSTSWLAVTADINVGSRKNIERAGFTPTAVLEASRLIAMGLEVLDPSKRYFLFNATGIPDRRSYLGRVIAAGGVQRGSSFLPIRFDVPIVRDGHV